MDEPRKGVCIRIAGNTGIPALRAKSRISSPARDLSGQCTSNLRSGRSSAATRFDVGVSSTPRFVFPIHVTTELLDDFIPCVARQIRHMVP